MRLIDADKLNKSKKYQYGEIRMDRITLKKAIENNVWRFVWAGEPTRKISVEMTYNELIDVVDALRKAEQELGID